MYQIRKYPAMVAYMDSGLKDLFLSMTDALSKWIKAHKKQI